MVCLTNETQLIEKLKNMLDGKQKFNPASIRKQALEICSADIIGQKWLSIYRSL